MALIKCPECENQISDKATSCPKCGYPFKKENSYEESSSNENIQNVSNNLGENKKRKNGIVILSILLGIVFMGVIAILLQDRKPPQIIEMPEKIVLKTGDDLNEDSLIESIVVKDNSEKECAIQIDDSSVNYDLAGNYVIHINVTDQSDNYVNGEIEVKIENYPVCEAYLVATNLSIDDLEKDSSGSYEYNGLNIPDEELDSIEDGTLYRTLAQHLEGFYFGEEFYGMWGENTIPVIWGIEKPDSWNELEPMANEATAILSRKLSLGALVSKIDSLDVSNGEFDYIAGEFSFNIDNLTVAAEELNITEIALGYTLAHLNEYGAVVEFNKNSCSVDVKWLGAERTVDKSDFDYYTNFTTKENMYETIQEENAGGYFLFDNPHTEKDNEDLDDVTGFLTNRGIPLGASMDAVIFSHAEGSVKEFDKKTDPIYEIMDSIDTDYAFTGCETYICYDIDDIGQLIYYFDSDERLIMVVYSLYSYY